MATPFNKEDIQESVLTWYLVHKLKQALKEPGNQPAPSTLTPSTVRSMGLPKRTRSIQAGKQERQPLANGKEPIHVEEPKTDPESEWIINIKDKIQQASHDDTAGLGSKLCIYRIPQCLRNVGDDMAYIPQIVSLGPYHHAKKRLQNMEPHKWRALHHMLKRNKQRIELYLDTVKELEERARSCYEGVISLSSNEFAEMMVLDSCFMLELFRGAAQGFTELGYSRNDPIFAMRATMHLIQRDMIMLENQIPLFILDKLLGLQTGKPHQTGVVARLALRFFNPLTPTDELPTKRELDRLQSSMGHSSTFDPLMDQGELHCLEVFRRNLLTVQTKTKPPPRTWLKREPGTDCVADKRRQQLIHCVTELKEGGIKFKKRKTSRFWDIKFKKGVLKIPRLLIHDGTKSLFLNLIAYEQSHLDCTSNITSYVIFMDNLIYTAADVSYLHYNGIIENWLGNDDKVAKLFSGICQNVVFDKNDSYLSNLSRQVNEYYDHKWNAWRASLSQKYFNSPWTIISFLAAVMLLLLTFAQTFYTVYPFYLQS